MPRILYIIRYKKNERIVLFMAKNKKTNDKYSKYKTEGRREINKLKKAEKIKKRLAKAKTKRLAKQG